jgi:hypothetical protein
VQPPATLHELVDQLGKTYSPFERLKILGRAWTLLRQMTPEQRMIVAAQLGLDHADEVVESIAKRSGQQASPALISMIERAQVKGTPHLPELIADLRDPSRRAERLRQGAKAVLGEAGTVLAGETPEVPWLPPGAAAPVEAPRRSAPAVAGSRQQPEPPRPTAGAPPPPKPQAVPAPPPAPVAPPTPVPAAAPPEPSSPQVREAAPPVPAPVPASPPPPVQSARPAPAPPRPEPARTSVDAPLAGRLAAVPSLTARFHLLRRHLPDAKGISATGLRSLIESFPDGWARRRALLELLRRGVPSALPDALALVEALGSERDRLWCLGALTDSREIPEEEREALLAAATSLTARRRLERRLGL